MSAGSASPGARPRISVILHRAGAGAAIDAFRRALAGSHPAWDFEFLAAEYRPEVAGGHPRSDLACESLSDLSAALQQATGEVVVALEAKHPEAAIPDLVRPILEGRCDMAVASRHVPGGGAPGATVAQRLGSRLGRILAWPFADVRDPLSGFFAIRRSALPPVGLHGADVFPVLALSMQTGDRLRAIEVPVVTPAPPMALSLDALRARLEDIHALTTVAGGTVSLGNATRFAAVGLLGVGIDLSIFETLLRAGAGLAASHIAGFVVAAVVNYLLNASWTFKASPRAAGARIGGQIVRFLVVALLALFFRGGVLALAVDMWGLPPIAGILLGIAVATVITYLGDTFYVFPPAVKGVSGALRWRAAAVGGLAYLGALRLVYLGLPVLLPEEAYYWNYSRHLAPGYLDHPPMVAWLIRLGTEIFGHNAFGVRFGAALAWIVAAIFVYRLAANLYDKSAALVALLLVSALPFFFGIGLLMTPDAPLVAAWAAALFFLERALLADRRAAWWGVGLAVGLGMLSKYTIALLGPATLVFAALRAPYRVNFRRPEPYLALLLCFAVFSPVIYWNATHAWASFAFQGPDRVASGVYFGLPALIGDILVLLSPTGLVAAGLAVWPRPGDKESGDPRRLFALVFTLVPLAVFVAFSVFHDVKLNWTGPLWLAVLPAIAAAIVGPPGAALARGTQRLRSAFGTTLAILMLIYGVGLHYMVLGVPGLGYRDNLRGLPIGWRAFARQAAAIRHDVARASGGQPIFVGMDKYDFASELAFYLDAHHQGPESAVGRNLLGQDALMYGYWYRPRDFAGKTLIMIAYGADDLSNRMVGRYFQRLGLVETQRVTRHHDVVGTFYYRVGYDYRPGGEPKSPNRGRSGQ